MRAGATIRGNTFPSTNGDQAIAIPDLPDVRELTPEIPEDVAVIVRRALERSRARRPTVRELAAVLARHL